jgi:hypothetical protein
MVTKRVAIGDSVETFLEFGTRLEDYAFIGEQGKIIELG